MKKSIQFLFILFIHSTLVYAQNLPKKIQNRFDNLIKNPHINTALSRNNQPMCLPDSSNVFAFNSPFDSVLVTHYKYHWDELSRKQTRKTFNFNSSNFTEEVTDIFDIDFYNIEHSSVTFEQNGNKFFGEKKIYFKNQLFSKNDSILYLNLDIASNNFVPKFKDVNDYDALGRVKNTISSEFISNTWKEGLKIENFYGTNGKLSKTVYSNYQNGWQPISQDTMFYNANDDLTKFLTLSISPIDSFYKYEIDYGSLTTVNFYSKEPANTDWKLTGTHRYKLDNKNRLIHEEGEVFDLNTEFKFFRDSTFGATDVDCLTSIFLNYPLPSTTLLSTKEFFFYSSPLPTQELPKTGFFNIYPNPNDGTFVIDAPVNTDLTISNAIGQVIFQSKIPNTTNNINLENYAAGVYFVTLKIGEKSETKKMVISEN
jgi:hypothetical protein